MSEQKYTADPAVFNRFMIGLSKLVGSDFAEATNHSGSCRCEKCLKWWVTMGPDDYGRYGPFTETEVLAARYPPKVGKQEDLDERDT